jgi:outer membrane protein OmpA-like peptidoglycan-associated protein
MQRNHIRGLLFLIALITIGAAISCGPTVTTPSQPGSIPPVSQVNSQTSTLGETPIEKAPVQPTVPPKPKLPEKVILDGRVLRSNPGKWVLDPSGIKAIQDVVKQVRENQSSYKVSVSGYSSSRGTRARTIAVSRHRAIFIAKTLADAGIPIEKISVKAYGPVNPVADNGTRDGRLKNQRVEIEFLAY